MRVNGCGGYCSVDCGGSSIGFGRPVIVLLVLLHLSLTHFDIMWVNLRCKGGGGLLVSAMRLHKMIMMFISKYTIILKL